MKHRYYLMLISAIGIIAFLTLWQAQPAKTWGFWAHQRINRLAVFTLPPEMIIFYKKHIEFITEHAVDPDKRRYASEDEAPRHFIDIDHYGGTTPLDTTPGHLMLPFTVMPRRWQDAVEKFTEDTLKAYGIVPWHTEVMLYRLQKAFEERNTQRILQVSADLGHYIGDGHVPLHTTENYNGHLTNQRGIHGFWESRIPELYGEEYDYWVGKAQYIDHPRDAIWEYVQDSHNALDSVFIFERELNVQYDPDQKYCHESRGTAVMQVYCEGYSKSYSDKLDGMVERRMRQAILNVGSLWYTAWVNAGKPDLSALGEPLPDEEFIREQEEMNKKFQEGKIKGQEHQN
jgi:hypothetical protein